MNKHKKFIILISILAAVLIAVWLGVVVFYKGPDRPVVREPSLYEVVNDIDTADRMMRLYSLTGEEGAAVDVIPQSLQAWEDLYRLYKNNQPAEFKRTRDWDRKLLTAVNHARKADELVKENRLLEANRESEAGRAIFKQMKEENGWVDHSDELLDLYQAGERVAGAANKEAVMKDLDELKFKFTAAKEYGLDIELIIRLEKLIGTLDKQLDGPEFVRTQKELVPLLRELYLVN